MIKKNLVFLYYHFSRKAQNKNKVGIKTIFFYQWWKYLKQKALHQFTFVLGGTKWFFEKQQTTNQRIIWIDR